MTTKKEAICFLKRLGDPFRSVACFGMAHTTLLRSLSEHTPTSSLLPPVTKSSHCGFKQLNDCRASCRYLLNSSGVSMWLSKDHFYTLVLCVNPCLWVTRLFSLRLLSKIQICLFFKWAETLKNVGQVVIGNQFIKWNSLADGSSRYLDVDVSKLTWSNRHHNCVCSSGKRMCKR